MKRTDPFYSSTAWKKCRRIILQRDHFLCQECLKRKVITSACSEYMNDHREFYCGTMHKRKLNCANEIVNYAGTSNPPTPPKEEEIQMFKPSSATKIAYEQFLTDAIKEGTIVAKWLTDFKDL